MNVGCEEQALPQWSDSELKLALSRIATKPSRAAYPGMQDDRVTPPIIRAERLHLASANIRYLSDIVRQLIELRHEAESDEYGALRVSQHAFDTACHLLMDAAILAAFDSRQIPHGCAAPDSEGGIQIAWIRPNAGVSLVVPSAADRAPYIYHELGTVHATEPATAEALARWLREIP
jgi:hypothetical protein